MKCAAISSETYIIHFADGIGTRVYIITVIITYMPTDGARRLRGYRFSGRHTHDTGGQQHGIVTVTAAGRVYLYTRVIYVRTDREDKIWKAVY